MLMLPRIDVLIKREVLISCEQSKAPKVSSAAIYEFEILAIIPTKLLVLLVTK